MGDAGIIYSYKGKEELESLRVNDIFLAQNIALEIWKSYKKEENLNLESLE